MTMRLDHYGLHYLEGDIALLVQETGVSHVLGFPMDFPVEVRKQRRGVNCPHRINLDEAEEFALPEDELVRAMLPVPKAFGDPIIHIEDQPKLMFYLKELFRLSSSSTLLPMWTVEPAVLGPMMQVTNVAPIIVYGYHIDHQVRLNKIIEAGTYARRQLIVVGPKSMVLRSDVKRISAEVHDLSGIPLERAGAWHLKQRMLHRE